MKQVSLIFRVTHWLMRHFLLSDRLYLSILYRERFNRKLDLKNPKSFNEKLQWLKLYGHKPEYVTMADKYAVKEYVANRIGREYVVPCLGVWEKAEDINFEELPNSFALKCTHNSGLGRCICKDKTRIDLNVVRREIAKGLRQNYYLPGRDKQYRDIPKKIIADMYLEDGTGEELRDYKWWCFNGEPLYMYYTNKGKNIYENFYDSEYNPVNINHGFERLKPEQPKPDNFELMKELATKLSKGIPFVRVDFFNVNGHVYFGEFTFFDWGGLRPFENYQMDLDLGKLIKLPFE